MVGLIISRPFAEIQDASTDGSKREHSIYTLSGIAVIVKDGSYGVNTAYEIIAFHAPACFRTMECVASSTSVRLGSNIIQPLFTY